MPRVKAKLRLSSTAEYQFKNIYADFLAYCEMKNLRPATLTYYRNNERLIEKYHLSLYPSLDSFTLDKLNGNWITRYITWLMNVRKLKPSSINTCLRAVKAFVGFASERGYVDNFPINKLKVDEEYKEPYSEEEIVILLRKPRMKRSNFLEYRNWVLINYMIGTANRLGSIANIKNKDVDLDQRYILLTHTKNRKRQIVDLTPTLVTVLKEYMGYRGGTPDDYLFCNQAGQALTVQAIVQAIHDYNLARGVQKTSCHLFRHTFALNWVKAGGGLVELQKILGHGSIRMVMHYVNMIHINVSATMVQYNPLERLSEKKKTMFLER